MVCCTVKLYYMLCPVLGCFCCVGIAVFYWVVNGVPTGTTDEYRQDMVARTGTAYLSAWLEVGNGKTGHNVSGNASVLRARLCLALLLEDKRCHVDVTE